VTAFDITKIPGWFDYAGIYDAMVERFGDGSHMAQRIKASGKRIRFSVIDVFDGNLLETFRSNLANAGLNDWVEIYQGRSQDAEHYPPLAGPFEFVWVDGSHALHDVYDDMSVWYPKVRQGGVFAGHDYQDWQFSPQVRTAVDRWTSERNIAFETPGTSWLIRK
jgi:hypothetical protein